MNVVFVVSILVWLIGYYSLLNDSLSRIAVSSMLYRTSMLSRKT